MAKRIHPVTATIALFTTFTFWISTVTTELTGSLHLITVVKQAIPWGFLLLVPALVTTGATGFAMAGPTTDARILTKKRRMPIIGAIGLLVLVPSALYLDQLATRAEFGGTFYLVQAIELCAGAVNITLLALNFRDGLRLRRRAGPRRAT
ncbi:hypothetical protein [Nocardia wallacei]|uniref:hypothetical protein n=1 Tax=Nocardia wallacei TaxID=480035 RepID=UPI00245734B0|nr:hypothetical protein [Nocardia wallacei]